MATPPRPVDPSSLSTPLEGSTELLGVASRLVAEGTAFALITVVRAVRPTSGKPGDKAILTERGEWLGWVGGSCAEPTARRAARAALEDGQCRLIHLTNDETDFARSGVEVAAMTCHSGGSLELYVEPHLPQPSLIVFGHSPIARAVAELGALMKYGVTRVTELESLPLRASFVVVASHGHSEVEALAWALGSGASYVGLVASQRRWVDVQRKLSELGLGPDQLVRVRAPAGLRIGASGAEEVALSVLSEIVAARRGAVVVAGEAPELGAASVPAPVPERRAVEEAAESCCAPRAIEPRASAKTTTSVKSSGTSASPSCCATVAEERAPTFSAVVLAAGLSRRMGAPNKLLLPVRGEPMIRQVLENVLAAPFVEVVVVLGHQAIEVGAAIAPLGVRSIVNADFASGQVSSVRAGLGALERRADAVMICLGDQPLLTAADLRDAQAAFARRGQASMLVPMYGEQRGNPVIIDWSSAQETLARGTHFGCRHFMAENPHRVYSWQSHNEHFVRDIDDPAEYEALLVAPTA